MRIGSIIFQFLFQIGLCAVWFWIGWNSCKNHQSTLKYKKMLKKLKRGSKL